MTLDSTFEAGRPVDKASTKARAIYKVGLAAVAACFIWAVTSVVSPTGLDEPNIEDVAQLDDEFTTERLGELGSTERPELVTDELVISSRVDSSGSEAAADADASGVVLASGDLITGINGEAGVALASSDKGNSGQPDASDAGTDGTDTVDANSASSTAGRTAATGAAAAGDYKSNLNLIVGASVRNANHDNSPYINTASAELTPSNHYGPRADYLRIVENTPEHSFPVVSGGQFRAGCEFSHFTYDDPLLFPGQPGVSHLHMHFGNTHVNAFTTHDTLLNTGSSTCNGQELNRTGYWVPAMFDGNGNVRIPERIVVYYKGEGLGNGNSQVYPDGAAMIASVNANTAPPAEGGVGGGQFTYKCSDNYSSAGPNNGQTIPNCDGSLYYKQYGVDNPRVVLEMNVKFPTCWNGKDASNYKNFSLSNYNWYGNNCQGEFNRTLPNLEYFVNYKVDIGEDTSGWYLSSDVDSTAFGTSKKAGGSTVHGDWWTGWHRATNQMWIDNCVNYKTDVKSGCGLGYLSDGGPNEKAPYDGLALKMRPQYNGPNKVSASTIFAELCPQATRKYTRGEDAAYCTPNQ